MRLEKLEFYASRAELFAVIELLTADRKPVKNADLWLRLDEVGAPHQIDWLWVKGHAGHPENERADALATAAAREARAASTLPRG